MSAGYMCFMCLLRAAEKWTMLEHLCENYCCWKLSVCIRTLQFFVGCVGGFIWNLFVFVCSVSNLLVACIKEALPPHILHPYEYIWYYTIEYISYTICHIIGPCIIALRHPGIHGQCDFVLKYFDIRRLAAHCVFCMLYMGQVVMVFELMVSTLSQIMYEPTQREQAQSCNNMVLGRRSMAVYMHVAFATWAVSECDPNFQWPFM